MNKFDKDCSLPFNEGDGKQEPLDPSKTPKINESVPKFKNEWAFLNDFLDKSHSKTTQIQNQNSRCSEPASYPSWDQKEAHSHSPSSKAKDKHSNNPQQDEEDSTNPFQIDFKELLDKIRIEKYLKNQDGKGPTSYEELLNAIKFQTEDMFDLFESQDDPEVREAAKKIREAYKNRKDGGEDLDFDEYLEESSGEEEDTEKENTAEAKSQQEETNLRESYETLLKIGKKIAPDIAMEQLLTFDDYAGKTHSENSAFSFEKPVTDFEIGELVQTTMQQLDELMEGIVPETGHNMLEWAGISENMQQVFSKFKNMCSGDGEEDFTSEI